MIVILQQQISENAEHGAIIFLWNQKHILMSTGRLNVL